MGRGADEEEAMANAVRSFSVQWGMVGRSSDV